MNRKEAQVAFDRDFARVKEMQAKANAVRWYKPWTWPEFFAVFSRMNEVEMIEKRMREYNKIIRGEV